MSKAPKKAAGGPSLVHENEIARNDKDVVVMGIDEAGRGPLAGEVFAAAVSLPLEEAARLIQNEWCDINDSKKLTASKREALAKKIKETPNCTYAISYATPEEIDHLNILYATHLAMRRAAEELASKLKGKTYRILVDGLPVKTLPFESQNIVKGDAKSLFIAAASILAKDARDASCMKLDSLYPEYKFAIHKGYPTPEHLKLLEELGPCQAHRQSFTPVAESLFFHGGKVREPKQKE
jgi:ribonuclease HII